MNIYLLIPFFALLLWRRSLDFPEKPSLLEIFFQRFGRIVMIPRAIIIPPEKAFQKLGGTPISTVLAFKISENKIIEILRDPIITKGIFLLFPSSALAHITIGRRGRTQGAKTVSIPDRNAITRSVISEFINN